MNQTAALLRMKKAEVYIFILSLPGEDNRRFKIFIQNCNWFFKLFIVYVYVVSNDRPKQNVWVYYVSIVDILI
jgi:hypothetical protein